MIPVLQATINVSDILDVREGSRRFNAAMRKCFESMGEAHQKMLPRHTDSGASTKYGYAMRSTEYVKRMRKAGIDWRPLKASGELKKSLQKIQRIVSTPSRGRMMIAAKLGGVVGVTDRFRMKDGQINLSQAQEQMLMRKAEITATTQDERDKIGVAGVVGFKKFIASGLTKRTRVR